MKICDLAWIETYNRCVKNWLQIPNRLRKMSENCRSTGDFFIHTVECGLRGVQQRYFPKQHKKHNTTIVSFGIRQQQNDLVDAT